MASAWDDIKGVLDAAVPLLETVAPTIATAVGGPLAGTAVTFLERALGLDAGSGAQPVAAVLATATPDQLAAVKKADNDFAVQMRQLDISVEKLDYDDRVSARQREAAVKDYTPAALAYLLTVGLFGFIVLLMLVDVPASSANVLNVVLGTVAAAWGVMIAYYYGSSSGAKAKDLLLLQSPPAKGAPK